MVQRRLPARGRTTTTPRRSLPDGRRSDQSVLECKLLLVDDEPANLVLMESVLAHAGFTSVTSMSDPSLVLARCRHDPPDLIVLDLHMPVVDGNAILRALAEIFGP